MVSGLIFAAISFAQFEPDFRFKLNLEPLFSRQFQAFSKDWQVQIDPKAPRKLQVQRNLKLGSEEFQISFGKDIVVEASTPRGAAWGLSSLGRKLVEGSPLSGKIRSKPDIQLRGLCLDVARRYHSPSTLRNLIRWAGVAKVSTVQLHLTDDQNWMLPTEVLKGVDRNNQHGLPAYTRAELTELQRFAEDRGVLIVPEIDLPGHSTLLVKHDPAVFQIQGSSGNCVNFGSTQVRGKLKALIDETAKLFPKAPYIHIGGDEASYPNAENDPAMKLAMQRLGEGMTPQDVFVDFIGELADHVIKLGKTPIVWEGFHASEFAKRRIPKQTMVVAWEGAYYRPARLQADGYRVINAGWDPYYTVNHFPYDVNTMVPLERLLNLKPQAFAVVEQIHPDIAPTMLKNPVEGSLMCWWEGHEWNAQTILPPRILAFGDSLWDTKTRPVYDRFLKGYRGTSAHLEEPAFGFSTAVSGTVSGSDSQFTDRAMFTFESWQDDLKFAVRTDGREPTVKDVISGNLFALTQSAVVSVKAYKNGVSVGETQFFPMKKVTVQRSLTTGAKVTTTWGRDPQFGVEHLVDGISDDPTGYWIAFPFAVDATIDLGSVKSIKRTQVVTQWQNGASTKYRLSGSVDSKKWVSLAAQDGPPVKATPEGYSETLPEAVPARYLKITSLGGELYPSTMGRILEVRAFGE